MNRIRFILVLSFFLTLPNLVFASSLDELYREIIKSDNEGYLPMFVKNRQAPEMLFEQDLPESIKKSPTPSKEEITAIKLFDEKKQIKENARQAELRWQTALQAVKTNQVSPIDLEEITSKVAQDNPQAVEIYAWMNARGVGVKQDLVEAFYLYKKALALGVTDANKNAAQVYKSMKKEQKESLTAFKN